MSWRYAHCGFSPLAMQGVAFGPLAAVPALGYAAMAASAALTVVGGIAQSNAQRQAGDIAYANALQRSRMANVQAQQLEVAAGQQVAAGQRQQLESQRKASVLAGRARAVMAASGGGVDENVVASLEGEGNYAGDIAAYDASEKARGMRSQADLIRYSGDAGVGMGAYERSADNSAADATLIGSFGKAALSFASKYGGTPDTPKAGAAGDFTAPYGTGGLDDISMSRLA